MALHFSLQINGEGIGYFVAERQERVIPEDRICTYDIGVETFSKPSRNHHRRIGVGKTEHHFRILHNYDHGPWELIRAALAELEEIRGANTGTETPPAPQQTQPASG